VGGVRKSSDSRISVTMKSISTDARGFHEAKNKQMQVLRLLRQGPLNSYTYQKFKRGSRLAPVIHVLKDRYGFIIAGDGKIEDPYRLLDPYQLPVLVSVSEEMKVAYYASSHWRGLSNRRKEFDGNRCVLCLAGEGDLFSEVVLQVHHIRYQLFSEQIEDLMTVCRDCHEVIHDNSRLKFPGGMKVEHVERLGFKPQWDSWLLP